MSVESESPWSHLPSDILNTIANILNNNADVDTCTLSVPNIHKLRLRSVCKSWWYSISPPPSPALNPSPFGHFNLSLTITYLLQQQSSTTNCKYWLLRVENSNTQNKLRILSPFNWILTLTNGFPKSINLLNFCVSQIATSYILRVELRENRLFFPRKVVVSTSGPLVALAIYGFKLYCIEAGDENWRALNDLHYHDVVFHKGKFYAVDIKGRTTSACGSDLKALETVPSFPLYARGGVSKNFVESNGELFLIEKKSNGVNIQLKICRLNEEKREWERVNYLGDHVFFIGHDSSYSIFARDFPGIIPNCVYFCDDSFYDVNANEEKLGLLVGNTGVYCLGDGKCRALAKFPDHWSLFWPPPSWLNLKALNSNK